jgi:hypothetical protein
MGYFCPSLKNCLGLKKYLKRQNSTQSGRTGKEQKLSCQPIQIQPSEGVRGGFVEHLSQT